MSKREPKAAMGIQTKTENTFLLQQYIFHENQDNFKLLKQ